MKSKKQITLFIFLAIFYFSCSKDHFIIYSMDGEKIVERGRRNTKRTIDDITLYFDRNDIQRDYIEVSIIATNNFFYGQFFFDEVFMDILKRKAQSIRAHAIIYEREKIDYPDYNDKYLYFTAIRYIK